MRLFHRRKEIISDSEYQINSQCSVALDFPKVINHQNPNIKYFYKKIKKRNRKTGQNDVEIHKEVQL